MAMADGGFWLGLFHGPRFCFRCSDSFVVPFLFALTRPCSLGIRGAFECVAYKVAHSPVSCPRGQHVAMFIMIYNIVFYIIKFKYFKKLLLICLIDVFELFLIHVNNIIKR